MGTISTIINTVLGAIVDFWEAHGERIMKFVKDAWGFIKALIDTTINAILGIIKAVLQIISGDWEGAWETIKGVAEDTWARISDTIENWLGTIKGIIEQVISAIKSWLSDRWDDIKTKVFDIWGTIKSIIAVKINAIKTNLKDKMSEIKTNIVNKWDEIRQAIADKWEEIKMTVANKIGDMISIITGAGQKFFSAGVGIINRLWDGLKSKIGEVISWFRSKIDEITRMFPWSSPPKDPTSPLQGLNRSGELFWDEWMQGAKKGFAKAQAGLSGMLGSLDAQMVVAPAAAMGAGGNTINNEFSFNPTINTEMDMVTFEQRVKRVVTDAVSA